MAVLNLRTGQRKTLIPGGRQAEYVETGDSGVRATGGALHAVRFDPARLEVRGDAVRVLEDVDIAATGAAQFGVSRSGALLGVSRTAPPR